MTLRLYFDDDSAMNPLVASLRAAGVEVVTADEAGNRGKPDAAHFAFAAANGYTLCTSNIGDFLALHREWVAAGRSHAGIILITQQKFSIGEQLRRLRLMNELFEPADIANDFEFLSDWGDDAP